MLGYEVMGTGLMHSATINLLLGLTSVALMSIGFENTTQN